MRRPPARDEGEVLGAPAGQGLSRRRDGDPAAGGEGTRKGPLAQRSPPLPRGPAVLRPPARGARWGPLPWHLLGAPASSKHLPFAEGKSRWNKSNFSRPNQVGEIKSQVTAGLFPECEWTTLTSTSANNRRTYIVRKELI